MHGRLINEAVERRNADVPENPMSPMTAYLRCWTPLMFSKSASTTSRIMRPKNAITPTTVPKPHALPSPL